MYEQQLLQGLGSDLSLNHGLVRLEMYKDLDAPSIRPLTVSGCNTVRFPNSTISSGSFTKTNEMKIMPTIPPAMNEMQRANTTKQGL